LVKNAEEEISKLSEFIDRYIDKEKGKKNEIKMEYEARLEKERRLSV